MSIQRSTLFSPRRNITALALLSFLWATGCSTPSRRIDKNPEMFNSFPAEVREKVSKGEIELGYSSDMVFIALGHPDRRYKRETADGEKEVWAYVDYRYNYEQQMVRGNFNYRDKEGHLRRSSDSVWVDVQTKTEYERLRVEFRNNEVSAIDRVEE